MLAGEGCRPLLGKFRRDNVDLLDVRWLSEEVVSPPHQRLGDLPDRCACRPESSGNTSKIANFDGPRRIANQAVVDASRGTYGAHRVHAELTMGYGKPVGDEVEVDTPNGRYRCRIVEVLRDRQPPGGVDAHQ